MTFGNTTIIYSSIIGGSRKGEILRELLIEEISAGNIKPLIEKIEKKKKIAGLMAGKIKLKDDSK